MAKILHGDRIGANASLKVGCAAVLFDQNERVLLTRRTDNGLWCLPGGAMDPGESATEACVREVLEETGLVVEVKRLVAVYSTPDRVTRYADGNTHQFVSLLFEVTRIAGDLGLSDETTEVGFFSPEETAEIGLMENHAERVADARRGLVETLMR